MGAPIGLFGKHPDYGDFISHRVDQPLVTWFQGWLDGVLPPLKDGLGSGWDDGWDTAPPLRFWIGRGLAGRTTAGVLIPSRDKVGRRYPLVLLSSGAAIAAPVVDPDQDFYERLEAARSDAPGGDIKDTVSALSSCRGEDDTVARETALLWAHHPEGDLQALLRSAGPQDARRAINARSYWWAASRKTTDPAVWLGLAGLPDAAALGWLLFGKAVQFGAVDA